MRSDPFAPATSPMHVKNLRATQAAESAEEREPDDGQRDILLEVHVTDRERQADLAPDDEELTRRATLVSEFFDELREDDEAENPTLADLTETLHVWHQHDDGAYRHQVAEDTEPEPYGWVAVEDLAVESSSTPEAEVKAEPQGEAGKRRTGKARARKGKQQPENLDDALAALDEDK